MLFKCAHGRSDKVYEMSDRRGGICLMEVTDMNIDHGAEARVRHVLSA